MSTEIVTALIVAGGSIICQLLINASNRKRQESENEKTKSLIVYRLDQLNISRINIIICKSVFSNLSECQPLRTKK